MMFAFVPQAALAGAGDARDTPGAIIPRPVEMEMSPGMCKLTPDMRIVVEGYAPEVRAVAEYVAADLATQTGWDIMIVGPADVDGRRADAAEIKFFISEDAQLGREGYQLSTTAKDVELRAPTSCGLFRGVQTLRQLVRPTTNAWGEGKGSGWMVPCVRIRDWPRYRWRGMLLDCGRHFMTKEFVKRYLDLLAYHKMNILHWHLTEDQGWRIEIKKYPKLTQVGAWRGDEKERYGGFYTQDDIKEIVAYAGSRYVTIVPEIEMPGHSLAALASYPELGCVGEGYEVGARWGIYDDVYCAGNERVFGFLEDVLSEVIGLFPSEYIHIGGDECPKTKWKACSKCQARIKAEGLRDEHELQSYFIRRIEKFLNRKGRRLIGWDEILEGGLAPNATVQSWRGMDGALAAATSGHDVIASPTSHCYLDYAQVRAEGEPTRMGYIPLERCYEFEPTPAGLTPLQARHILGIEGNMWTEHAPQKRVDWQVFPRLCALAEVGWSPPEARDWGDFSARMKTHYRRLDALGVTYFLPPPRCTSPDRVFQDTVELVLDNPLGRGAVRYTLDGCAPTLDSPPYVEPVRLTDTTVVKAQTFLPTGCTSGIAEFCFRKLSPREPVEVPHAVSGLAYAYYEGSWQRLPDFEQLTPAATGTTPTFDLGVRQRDDGFALRFTGYLQVPVDGVYTFHLISDDGSRLWIDFDLVVDHDGLHSACEVFGQVMLKAGKHPITVAHFEAGGAQHLKVSYAGPGITKQPIPGSVLWRLPTD